LSGNEYKRPKPVIFGCAGTRLTSLERGVFRDANPFGFILFKRNCESPDQVRYLILELQQAVGRDDIQIAIDQEGGRVSRLQPPHWPKYPPARAFGLMYERDPEWGMEAIKLYARDLSNSASPSIAHRWLICLILKARPRLVTVPTARTPPSLRRWRVR
jgi:beta-glucosidase-like glycosyl hydrolase